MTKRSNTEQSRVYMESLKDLYETGNISYVEAIVMLQDHLEQVYGRRARLTEYSDYKQAA